LAQLVRGTATLLFTGFFRGIQLRPATLKGAETDSGFSNVPKIAHFPQKSMIYDQKSNFGPLYG
jgi:hypothetical protein